MKLKYSVLLFFMCLGQFSYAQCLSGCVNIQLRSVGSILEVWLMPTTATYTGPITTTFTISWDAVYNVGLGPHTVLVSDIPILLDSPTGEIVVYGGKKYVVYAAFGVNNVTLTQNTPLKIMTVPLTGTGNHTVNQFSISDDAYITTNNYNYYLEVGGQAGGATLDLTGTTSSIAINVVLPLELLSFRGVEQDKGVALFWKTARESNFSHFEVERSSDGKNWLSIDKIKGGNREGGYFVKDASAFSQNKRVLYRLKMVNTDASSAYSSVITVEQKDRGKGSLSIFPNPTHNELNIIIDAFTEGVQTLEIVDVFGQVSQRKVGYLQKGQNQETLNISSLAAGVYFLRYFDSKSIKETIKFIKL